VINGWSELAVNLKIWGFSVFSDFFVLDFPNYKSFMHLDKDSFGGGI
jgi:hypothetical protein